MLSKGVPVAEHHLASSSNLSPRELEILRLLASGHTAKTIAVQLGCSETAINERLREARRKTGAVSSRELARQLDAQKIWDKNIDLPAGHPASDGPVRPTNQGPGTSKGILIMLVAISAAALGLLALAPPVVQPGDVLPAAYSPTAQASALTGSWSLDVARIPEAERPKGVTITFRLSPDKKWTTRVEVVGPDGVTRRAESTAAADGVAVPITGDMGNIDSVALRQPTPNTLVMTLGKNGAPVSTRVYTVAKDRKAMTETIVWAGDAMPKLETTHFTRAD